MVCLKQLSLIEALSLRFESTLFNHLLQFLGSHHHRTTAYHPSSNGMVERLHRHLKSALKAHQTEDWVRILPFVLLGIRTYCCSPGHVL